MQQATLHQKPINFKRERDFSEKLNATFAFTSQHFRPIAKNLFLIAGPFALLMGICYGIYQTYTFGVDITNPGSLPWNTAGNSALLLLGSLGMFVFSLIAGTLVVAILMRHIKAYVAEGNTHIPTSQMWNTIWPEFFNVLGTSVFIFFAFILLVFALMIPAGVIGAAGGNPVLMGFFVLLCFLGLLFLAPALMLLYPIRSIEGVGVFSAISRMFRLISGKWLSTIGLLIVIFIFHSIISMVFSIPMYIVLFLKVMHAGGLEMMEAPSSGSLYDILLSLTSGISMLGTYILSGIVFIALTFQYFNLLERKEASGLLERMETFGQQKPDTEDDEEHY